jgi:hypothetical protein
MKTFEPYALGPKLAIIKDLLQKRPHGGGDRQGMDIRMAEDWCPRYNKHRMLQSCNKSYWGYTEHQVHRLNLVSEGQVQGFILEQFYGGRSDYELSRGERGGLSRKVNRIWDRIQLISTRVRNGRLPGAYEIKCGDYYDGATLGYVLASDVDHAVQLGTTLFGAWAGDREIGARYKSFPTADHLQVFASSLQTSLELKLTKERADHVARIEKIENEIKSGQMAMLVAMDMIESSDAA